MKKKTKNKRPDWVDGLPVAITVTSADGTITNMNVKSCETFAKDGGEALIGTSVFDCHPEPSKTKTVALYRDQKSNHYTIEKKGQKKIIHQIPWFQSGQFAGFVEISIPIPDPLPHTSRDES